MLRVLEEAQRSGISRPLHGDPRKGEFFDSCFVIWLIPRYWFPERGVVRCGGVPGGRWVIRSSGAGREAMRKWEW